MKCRKQLISALLHADDTVILAEDEKLMRRGLEVLMEWCDEWSVEVNVEKSGIMHMRRKGRKGIKRTVGRFYMLVLKRYKWYKYLGSVELTSTYNYHHDRPPHSEGGRSAKNTICASGWMQTPPAQVAEGDTTSCKWTICSIVSAPVQRRETPQVQDAKVRMQGAKVRAQGAKVRASISAI